MTLGGGGVSGQVTKKSSGTEKQRTRRVNVALTQVKLQKKAKNKPSNKMRRDEKTVDAVIHDKLLNGTGEKVKL